MAQGSNNKTPYMAPGLVRDKVADRFATLNPSIRITPLSGKPLRDQIGRAMLREAQDLYTLWQRQDSEKDVPILDKTGNTFSLKPELAPYWNDPFFRNLVADRVRFALTRYFSRKAQVADIIYNDAILNTSFPVSRAFALAFLGDNPLKPGDSRKIKLKMDGKRYHAMLQRPGPAREYRIVYGAESEPTHALREYLGDNLKSGETAFTLRTSGKSELIAEKLGG